MFTDSHCHLNFPELVSQLPAIRQAMEAAQVTRALCICTTMEEFEAVHGLAMAHDNFWSTVGVHPDNEGVTEPTQAGPDATAGAEGVEDPLGPPAEGDGLTDPGVSAEDGAPADPTADRRGSSVEELIADLERTAAERDDYLDKWRRNQADFENSRKRLIRDAADSGARATETLVEKLLPVLDACDGAISHGADEVGPGLALAGDASGP